MWNSLWATAGALELPRDLTRTLLISDISGMSDEI